VRRHPVATKRVLRAIIKATDLCVVQPERVAQHIVDGGFTPRYDFALQSLKEIPYAKWRDYHAQGPIPLHFPLPPQSALNPPTPNKIIADGTDWRFLNELKRELKS